MPVGGEAASSGSHLVQHATGSNVVVLNSSDAVAPPAGFATREDAKKQRELEEARKSGLIPAEKDEEGKDINPHIPQYIAKAPWYLSQDSRPSLKHQRFSAEHASNFHKWYQRGLVSDAAAVVKFRKGACQNCGAMSHQAKDCTERPRKKGAKWTGQDIRPDELIVEDSAALDLDFDGKRDRYGGYDPSTYRLIVRDFELADIERKKRKAIELQQDMQKGEKKKKRHERKIEEQDASGDSDSDSDSEDGDDEDLEDVKMKDFDQINAPIGMKDDRTRTTMMNLRIREDTAKYLFNLDVESAFYDPKTRSMRDNPLKHLKDSEQGIYRGDNVMRHTGNADTVTKMEIFAWEAYKHEANVHAQAQPTQLELLHKEHARKRQELIELKRQQLLEKYGATQSQQSVQLSQSEAYLEYTPDGSVKAIRTKTMTKSKYQEDAYFGDHTSVWGSYYDRSTSSWGYACCKEVQSRLKIECTAIN